MGRTADMISKALSAARRGIAAATLLLAASYSKVWYSEPYGKEPEWPEPHVSLVQSGHDFEAVAVVTGEAADELHTVTWDIDGASAPGDVLFDGKAVASGGEIFLADPRKIHDDNWDGIHGNGYTRQAELRVRVPEPALGDHLLRIYLESRYHNHLKHAFCVRVMEPEFGPSGPNLVVGVDVDYNYGE